MAIPSDTDLWMFVSSAGGLTAGRTDPDGALFPYVTEDLLHDAHHTTGPVTLLRVRREGGEKALWEPFARAAGPGIERNLYKHPLGTPVEFEEIHHGLGLAFRYRWQACESFGHVRTATLENLGGPVEIELLDGLCNLLPTGAPLALYQHSSSLLDAYRRSEVEGLARLGIYSLTARITDRAEAAEELRASVAWSLGLDGARLALSAQAVETFRTGGEVEAECRLNGRRGHYLLLATLALERGASHRWRIAADSGRDHLQVAALRERLASDAALPAEVERALAEAAGNLRRFVAAADGLQHTADVRTSVHHTANVLFNVMRGGVFADGHRVPRADFAVFVRAWNREAADRHAAWLAALPEGLPAGALRARAAASGDPTLERLAYEYLPLHFARRHGDPSRPWNRFSIRVREPDGSRAMRYEGNWRDIFQNWDALAASYPEFLPSFVAKFVNASTVDGFNPYRIGRDGVDWEVEEPGHPWSNIGYWGDHQVAYLGRFLESLRATEPGALEALLDRAIFTYADVPYRIAPFAELVERPRATIRFDHARDRRARERAASHGADGRLVRAADGGVLHVTLFEKLLVPVLARLSNLVPGAGIWMNTQRPEWNDANNALAGHGASVVTLAYLRRMLGVLEALFSARAGDAVLVSREVVEWARELAAVLAAHDPAAGDDDRARAALLAALGAAFSRYREAVYERGFSGREAMRVAEALALIESARLHVDHALAANRREDGLWHAYNLLAFAPARDAVSVERLPVMLEGQVAALSSGLVTPGEAVAQLDALFASALFRADQQSFMLYPEKTLPGFLESNVVPAGRAEAVPLLAALLAAGERSLVARDVTGAVRFAAGAWCEPALEAALDRLGREPRWHDAVERDRAAVRALYEATFHHHAFLGRSGTMYAYEGVGSIYWHMVAKLLLAVQEMHRRAVREGAPEAVRESLARHYFRIRGGLGFEKSAEAYGAFPTDPYSHTPSGRGARQPGMTGQVKEEILTRLGELGVEIEGGRVAFRPALLRAAELLATPATFDALAPDGTPLFLDLPAGSLAFTFAQVPVRYFADGGDGWVRVTMRDGRVSTRPGDALDHDASRALLARSGEVSRVDVGLAAGRLRSG